MTILLVDALDDAVATWNIQDVYQNVVADIAGNDLSAVLEFVAVDGTPFAIRNKMILGVIDR